MKAIFIDIDGVLFLNDLHPETSSTVHLSRLKTIVNKTGAKLILSSSWRINHFDLAKKLFSERELEIIDKTADDLENRALEISEFLKKHPEINDFIIIDDEECAKDFRNTNIGKNWILARIPKTHEEFVRCYIDGRNSDFGLNDIITNICINKLGTMH